MIDLVFTVNREILKFKIKDKVIYYTDRKWKKWIQCVPKDPNLIRLVSLSRNKLPMTLVKLFDLSEKEQEEYNKAKDENGLAEIMIRDAKTKGCKMIGRTEDGS